MNHDKIMIDECIELAGHEDVVDWFDDSFLMEIYEKNNFASDEYIPLTPKQRESIENILNMLRRKTGFYE